MLIRLAKSINRYIKIKMDPVKYAKSIGVKVGNDCRFLSVDFGTFGSEPYLVEIGNHVTITSGVRFITHDGGVWVFRKKYPDIDMFGPIKIKDNVFIGIDTIILPNVTIGSNSIVGAGSIVNKDVPPNSVVAGVPAKHICSTEEYFSKNVERFSYIRSYKYDKKKQILKEKYKMTGI